MRRLAKARSTVLVIAAALTLAVAAPAPAATWRVTGTGDGVGTCALDACSTLRSALAAADGNPGPDAVSVPAGHYGLSQGELVVNGEVSITGANARTTVIAAAANARVFNVSEGASATIAHLTMSGGQVALSNQEGGDLLNGGRLALDHVRATGGSADVGGGVVSYGPVLTVDHSLIDHNTSHWGGGMSVWDPGSGENPSLVEVRTSTIASNVATDTSGGSGIQASNSGQLRLSRVTITGNAGGESGLRVFNYPSVTIANSIVSGNIRGSQAARADCYLGKGVTVTSLGGNVEGEGDCGFTDPTDRQNVAVAPTLSNNGGETDTVALAANSPAVDLDPPCPTETDQRDVRRNRSARCDSGAYELQPPLDTTVTFPRPGVINTNDFTVVGASNEPSATLDCGWTARDFAYLKSCSSHLDRGPGDYTLTVSAELAGEVDPTPVVIHLTYAPGEPRVAIAKGPGPFTRDPGPAFSFTASLPQSPIECRLDGPGPDGTTFEFGTWGACSSPQVYDDLPDGSYVFDVRGFDDSGDPGTVTSRPFTIDTVDPDTTLLSGPSGPTASASPSFSFGASEAGATFECRLDGPGTAVGTFAACASPQAYPGLADGRYRFFVRARDQAGNVDASPGERDFTVDTAAPDAPAITAPAADVLQRTDAIQVIGRAERDAAVTVFDNGLVSATTTAGAGGNWVVTVSGMRDGAHGLQARAADAAGNLSPRSATVTVRVDTVAPGAPVIAAPGADTAQRSGFVVVQGTAEPNARLAVLDGGTVLDGTFAFADATGHWSVVTSELAEGDHGLQARATDAAGNAGAPSARVTVRVDRTPPAAPVITAPADGALQSAATVRVAGTAEPGGTVSVADGGGTLGAATAGDDGHWSTSLAGLRDGSHALQARTTDRAGNAGALSDVVTVRIDTQPPAAPVILGPPTGEVQSSPTFSLTGTAEPGAVVEVREDTASRGTATAAADGSWSVPLAHVADGPHAYIARATDPAGNAGPPTAPWTVHVAARAPTSSAPPASPATPPAGPPASPVTPATHPTAVPLHPAFSRSVVVTRVRGRLRLKLRGGAFAPLRGERLAPYGTIVDASAGAVRVTAQPRAAGAPASVVASAGRFRVTRAGATTVLRLIACPGRLWADGGPGFATRAARTTAAAKGAARWRITDDCRRVRVRVARGAVRVRAGGRTHLVRAIARAR